MTWVIWDFCLAYTKEYVQCLYKYTEKWIATAVTTKTCDTLLLKSMTHLYHEMSHLGL